MTRDEALLEAQRRWGKYAFVQRYSEPEEYTVGRYYSEPREIFGHSEDSWEGAFADADLTEPTLCSCGADLRSIPFIELQKHDKH